MNRLIYLDNAATTKLWPQVEKEMEPYFKEEFGNASTAYQLGEDARHALEEVRKNIASTLHAKETEIFFTSGGSEADNWAIKGIAATYKKKGMHIITTAIEHHAVLNSCDYLEKLGYEITYLKPDAYGQISLEELRNAIRQDTILISIMFANNEIGTIEPIWEIGRIAKDAGILFHTDAVQAYAQVPISMKHYPIDLLSASAHKFHGPKGVGFLYVREGVKIPSFIHGGSQEKGKRAGTENVPGIIGMGKASQLSHERMKKTVYREIMLRNYLTERIFHEIPHVHLNGHPRKRLPGNMSFSFQGVEGAALLMLLEEDGICASGGSACNTGEERVSYVIREIGVPEDYAPGTVRFSLSAETTKADIDDTVESLKRNVTRLRN